MERKQGGKIQEVLTSGQRQRAGKREMGEVRGARGMVVGGPEEKHVDTQRKILIEGQVFAQNTEHSSAKKTDMMCNENMLDITSVFSSAQFIQ